MIKVNYYPSENFLNRYEQKVVTEGLIPAFSAMSLKASKIDKQRISALFTDQFIKDLVLCDANELYEKIFIIYDKLHELSERYCLEYYLKDVDLDPSVSSMPIRKKAEKEIIKAINKKVLIKLRLLSNERQSIYLPLIIRKMESAVLASDIKAHLTSLNSMKIGNHTLSDEIKALYPDWVNEFVKVFNYEAISKFFGHEITNGLNLDICPYCNNEDIETINEKGAETRPDLDHFFPKSKFPFLALTLSNLIPAGGRCNQRYKRDASMLGYVHPYISGITQEILFNFNFMFDEGRSKDALDITVNKLNNDLDKNLELFKIRANHNKNNVKDWFIKLDERYQLLLNTSNENAEEILNSKDLIRLRFDVDLDKSPTKEQYQKLKIDALNFLTGRSYYIAD